MMQAASRRVLLIDHTEFSQHGLYALAPLTEFDLALTEDVLPAAEQRRLRDDGVTLKTVS
ncbi:DeoR/GlpR family DNA-binding transcription regulator [Saccharopolyspora mangrovi]|uniref:DeoR C-terminal sensor domain-containing protein n=1 Tax=Saccharopolyspora mangrovi TaxID=3082379 RepID=A0ABU6AED6_9PSEU|nr:hypothetical protein [Saccharopolyspora sp. S2-29]MEB3369811.1 hypothetical protein [Saccharopolyspora sp. S2-29]